MGVGHCCLLESEWLLRYICLSQVARKPAEAELLQCGEDILATLQNKEIRIGEKISTYR